MKFNRRSAFLLVASIGLFVSLAVNAEDDRSEAVPLIESRKSALRSTGVEAQQEVRISSKIRADLVGLAKALTADGVVQPPYSVLLNLLEDSPSGTVSFTGLIHTAYQRSNETTIYEGTLAEDPSGVFTLIVHDGLITLQVSSARGSYRVYPFKDRYFVEEDGTEPEFRDRVIPALPLWQRIFGPRQTTLSLEANRSAEDGSRVDILVLYTTSTRVYWGGTSHVVTNAMQMEAFLNQAFANSLPTATPPLRARFVRIEEIPDSVGSSLPAMARSSIVRTRRDAANADLVVMIHHANLSYAGIAWIFCGNARWHRDHAFGIVRKDHLVKWKTVAHEIGHSFGAGHDPQNAGGSCWHNDSRGHNFRAVDQGVRRLYGTIMSYPGASNRIPHFSNPDVPFLGIPTGISGARNNARAIMGSRSAIANYRVSTTTEVDGPSVTFLRPEENAQLPARSTIEVAAKITDPNGVSTVELFWERTGNFLACPGTNNEDWRCSRSGDEYIWAIEVGVPGSRTFYIRAVDAQGNRTITSTRTIRLTQR